MVSNLTQIQHITTEMNNEVKAYIYIFFMVEYFINNYFKIIYV